MGFTFSVGLRSQAVCLDVLSGLVRHALFQTTTQVANDLEDDVSFECSSFDWEVSLNKVSQVRCRFGWPASFKFLIFNDCPNGAR